MDTFPDRFQNQLAPTPQLHQGLFGLFAFREISDEGAEYPSSAMSNRRDCQLYGEFVSIAMDRRKLYSFVDDRTNTRFEKYAQALLVRLAIPSRDNRFGQGITDDVFPSPANGNDRLRVPVDNAA